MARKNKGPALFEVISKTRQQRRQENLAVPKWMDSRSDTGAGQSGPSTRQPAARAEPAEPTISMGAGRLVLSLDYIACLAVSVGLAALLVVAFWLGRATAPEGAAQAQAAGQPPLNTNVLDVAKPQPPAQPAANVRDPNKYYLVVQTLQGTTHADQADAEQIVEFLSAAGEPAEVGKTRIGGRNVLVVWSLTPMDSRTSPQATAYAEAIERLGKKYFAKHGKYRFQQRRTPSSELGPYYVPGQQSNN